MENYSYPTSYPDSSHSSPHSREIEFETPSPWDDQSSQLPPNYKVKFMCSYNGKITPRPHDNALTYVGGETKILAVDRNIKFPALIGKLSGLLFETDVVFKYQLPGEDLDALISVTNDDDLEHMMHEYDRLNRAGPKPGRMRLFLFRVDRIEPDRFGSGDSKFSEKDRFVEALNSAPPVQDSLSNSSNVINNNVDFLFGLERGVPVPVRVPEPEVLNRVVSDPVQRFVQEQHDPTPAVYRQRTDDVNYRVAGGGEYYAPAAAPEKQHPPISMPVQVQSYWQENQIPVGGGGYAVATNALPDQPVYMMHAPPPGYHQQMHQGGYYAVPRVGPEAYREQGPPQAQHPVTAMYSMVPAPKMAVPTPGSGYPPSSDGGATGYAQVGYDSSGRQVYYTTAPGGGVNIVQAAPQQQQQQQQQQVSTTTSYGQQGQEGKMVVTKVTQAPV